MAVSNLADEPADEPANEHAECLPSVAASPTCLSGDCVHDLAETAAVVTPPKTPIKNAAIVLAIAK